MEELEEKKKRGGLKNIETLCCLKTGFDLVHRCVILFLKLVNGHQFCALLCEDKRMSFQTEIKHLLQPLRKWTVSDTLMPHVNRFGHRSQKTPKVTHFYLD